MSITQLVLVALVALALFASGSAASSDTETTAAASKKEFPLVWVCLGITIVGVIVAMYVAYRRPDELELPGSVVMTMQESEAADGSVPQKSAHDVV